jgi:regulator of sigma E protease
MQFFVGILPLLILISVIVTIHELGHFSVARLFKTKIERFSVGFGPKLLARTDKNGVEWCLSAIPLGGYVKFAGDEHVSSMSPDARELDAARTAIVAKEGEGAEKAYFHFKPVWQRMLIVAAGPFANFVLAIVLFAGVLMFIGKGQTPASVVSVEPNSPAAAAGFKPGDLITEIDGRAVENHQDARTLILMRADSAINITVLRDGAPVVLNATPARTELEVGSGDHRIKAGRLGIEMGGDMRWQRFAPHTALVEGAKMTWQVLDTNVTYIGRIFAGKESGDQLSGILGMTKGTGDIASETMKVEAPAADRVILLVINLVTLAAVISVGIGFLNLLPVPVLDGGHLLFYTYEAVMQKPLNSAIQGYGYRLGLVTLLGLMLFATWNDLNQLGVVKFFGGLFS